MEQPLKQRLTGAIILISLAVIFLPMLIGNKPTDVEIVDIQIPAAPADLPNKIVTLPEQEAEEFAEVKISAEKGVQVTVKEPVAEKEPSKSVVKVKVAPKVVQLKKPIIPKPPKLKPVESITSWVVQVGSFSDGKNANALSNKLIKAGFTAFVEESSAKKGATFRVRVGPELSREKADTMKTKLQKEQGIKSALVVQYP